MSERLTRISKLRQSRVSRASYIRAKLSVLIPSQIRALRQKLFETQTALGKEAEMKQSRISAMERPGAVQFNIETLVRLASAFKIGLIIKFVPFSEMLRWENDFNQDTFNPVAIDDDAEFIAEPDLGPIPSLASGEVLAERQQNLGSCEPIVRGAASELMQTQLTH